MPIPSLNEHGLLPPGIHDCSLEELNQTTQHWNSTGSGSDLVLTRADLPEDTRSLLLPVLFRCVPGY